MAIRYVLKPRFLFVSLPGVGRVRRGQMIEKEKIEKFIDLYFSAVEVQDEASVAALPEVPVSVPLEVSPALETPTAPKTEILVPLSGIDITAVSTMSAIPSPEVEEVEIAEEAESEEQELEPNSGTEPVKRKRGRPRKVVSPLVEKV